MTIPALRVREDVKNSMGKKSNMPIHKDEMETTFLIDGIDSEFVDCYSCSAVYVRKLKKIAEKLGIAYTTPFEGGIRVRLPIACILLRHPKKMSEEARAAASLRFKATLARWEAGKVPDDNSDNNNDDEEE